LRGVAGAAIASRISLLTTSYGRATTITPHEFLKIESDGRVEQLVNNNQKSNLHVVLTAPQGADSRSCPSHTHHQPRGAHHLVTCNSPPIFCDSLAHVEQPHPSWCGSLTSNSLIPHDVVMSHTLTGLQLVEAWSSAVVT
jgi:hypothetical protein